jgi:hypothetical protein
MFLTHALRAIYRAAVVTGDSLWKYVTLLLSGTPPANTFVSDNSNNSLVITPNGDARPSNFSPYTPGYYSNYFDGTGDYLITSNIGSITGNFTIEYWYYPQVPTNTWYPYVFGSNTPWITGIGMSYTTQTTVSDATTFDLSVAGVSATVSTFGTIKNKWNHIAVVRSGSTITAYLNGVSAATLTNSSTIPTTTFYIGGTDEGGSYDNHAMKGNISNFRIVKGTALYTASFTPSTTPLTAVSGTSLLTCQSNRLIDTSPNNFAITKNGDTTVSGFQPFATPTSANINTLYSTYFDGTGDYLTAASNAAFVMGTSDWTIEGWVYVVNVGTNYPVILSNQTASFTTGSISLTASNVSSGPSKFLFSAYDVNAGSTLVSSATNSTNTWYHVAVVRNGTNLTMYRNGTSVATTTISAGVTFNFSSTGLCIGGGNWDGAQSYFTGNISNFRIVKGTALYTANFTPPTADLTAISGTSLLTCQSSTTRDNSTNAFAITSNGDARPIPVSPFTQTTTAINTTYLGSAYFDGTGDYLVGPTSNANLLVGTGDFTIEYWAYKTTSAALGTVVSFGSGTGNLRHFIDGVTPSLWNGASAIGNGNTITINTWTHIVLQRSGTTIRFYTNGVSSTPITSASNFSAGTINIGGEGASNSFPGYITNFRFIRGTALYSANFDPPAQPLTAVTNTQLLACQTNQPATNKMFVDNSGSNLPITQAGNTTQGTFSPYSANWSNYFDGTGDYLQIPDNAAFVVGTGDFTIEAWIYPTQVAASEAPIFKLHSTGSIIELRQNTNKLDCHLAQVDSSVTVSTGTVAMAVNTWNHVAFVRTGTTTYTFVNGVLDQTKTSQTQNLTTTVTTKRIAANQTAAFFFTGYISNFRFVKGTALYTAAFTPSTTPFTATSSTSVLTCQSPSLIDNSPNALAITKAGDVSVQRFSPFSPIIQTPTTYSTYFDGTGDYLTATGSAAFTLGTGDFTIECWFYTAVGTNNAMFQLSNTAGGFNTTYTNTIAIGLLAGKINLYGVAGTGITSTGSSYATSTWTHVALVRSSGVTKLYINGVLDTTVGTAGSITDTTSYTMQYVVVGGYYSTAYLWNGYVSNLRVVKGTAVYTAAFTPPTTPLTAITNTSLLTCQSATHIDNSSNAFTLTQNGDAVPRQFNPFGFTNTTTGTAYTPALYGGSAYFDGTGDYITAPTNAAAFSFATGDFTAEMQLYPTAFASYKSLWGCSSGAASSTGFHTGLNASGNVFIYSASAFKVTTSNAMNLNAWNHVAFVRNGTALNIYINGVLGGTWTLTTQTFTDSAGWFGAAPGLASEYYTGYLNDLKITKGTALYKASFVPPLAPLTATAGTSLLLNMDKGGVADSSRSNDLETVGDAKINYETPYAGSYYSNYFDGTGDYLEAASNAAFALPGDFTFELWFRSNNTGATSQWCEVPVSNGIQIYYSGTQIFVSAYGVSALITYTYTMPLGVWTHLAVVRSGTGTSNLVLYINGVSVATATSTLSFAQGAFRIGGTSYYFNGNISNARLVKGTAVYTSAFTPSTTPLTAISGTSLLTCQSKSFVDNSTNAFTITRNGDTAVKSFNPFQKNTYSSMYFDGTGDYLTSANNLISDFGTGDFTVEFWMNASAAGTYVCVVGTQAVSGNTTAGMWRISNRLNSVNGIYFNYSTGSAFTDITFSTTNYNDNAWHHVVACRTSNSLKMYVDGVSVGTATTVSQSLTSGKNLQVGYQAQDLVYYTGYIADLRITKSARYSANFTPPTAPLPTA